MSEQPVVKAVEVVKHYEGGLVEALRGVSLEVARGEDVPAGLPPPWRAHLAPKHDHVLGVLAAIDADAAEAVVLDEHGCMEDTPPQTRAQPRSYKLPSFRHSRRPWWPVAYAGR